MEFDSIVSKKKAECTREYLGQTVAGSILLIDVINSGSFGDIYHGRDKKTGKEYAVKFNKNETERGFRNFYKEYDIMKLLKGKGMFPICSIEYRGSNKVGKDVLIMEKLGLNVYDLFRICNKSLSPWTMSFLIQQFILRMKELHACGIVHRDIKPENFCIANPYSYEVYLIDFGLSKDFLDEDGVRRPNLDKEGFVGTPRYSSRHAHKGTTQGPRDDMEAIGYMCIFLMKGSLPWQNIKIKDRKEKHKALLKEKTSIDLNGLCSGLPKEFAMYLQMVRNLDYDEEPNYDQYIQMFKNLIRTNNVPSVMDWENKKENTSLYTLPRTQTGNSI